MNAPRYDAPRPRPTHTVWPTTRPQAAPAVPQRKGDATKDPRHDDDHASDEPGYGHGV